MAVYKCVKSGGIGRITQILRYVQNEEKTDGMVIGIGCDPEIARQMFFANARSHNKLDGRAYMHRVISFPEGEVNAFEALDFARELFSSIDLFKDHQIILAVHQNEEPIHVHAIIDAVNTRTGKKFHTSKKDLADVKAKMTEMLQERGLYVPQKGKSYDARTKTESDRSSIVANNQDTYRFLLSAEALADAGKTHPSYVRRIGETVTPLLTTAESKEDFITGLTEARIGVRWPENGKTVTFTDLVRQETGEAKCKIRLSRLAEYYNLQVPDKNGQMVQVSTQEILMHVFEANAQAAQILAAAKQISQVQQGTAETELQISQRETKSAEKTAEAAAKTALSWKDTLNRIHKAVMGAAILSCSRAEFDEILTQSDIRTRWMRKNLTFIDVSRERAGMKPDRVRLGTLARQFDLPFQTMKELDRGFAHHAAQSAGKSDEHTADGGSETAGRSAGSEENLRGAGRSYPPAVETHPQTEHTAGRIYEHAADGSGESGRSTAARSDRRPESADIFTAREPSNTRTSGTTPPPPPVRKSVSQDVGRAPQWEGIAEEEAAQQIGEEQRRENIAALLHEKAEKVLPVKHIFSSIMKVGFEKLLQAARMAVQYFLQRIDDLRHRRMAENKQEEILEKQRETGDDAGRNRSGSNLADPQGGCRADDHGAVIGGSGNDSAADSRSESVGEENASAGEVSSDHSTAWEYGTDAGTDRGYTSVGRDGNLKSSLKERIAEAKAKTAAKEEEVDLPHPKQRSRGWDR